MTFIGIIIATVVIAAELNAIARAIRDLKK